MKQTIGALALLSLLAAVFPISAQEVDVRAGGNSNLRPQAVQIDYKVQAQTRLASSTATTSDRRASSTERRIELQQGIAKRKADHTGKILLATIERLEKLADRIDSRITKVESNGGNASSSKAFVVEARVHLREARASLSAFSSIDLSGVNLSDNFERVREAAANVKEHLRLAHRSLVNAILSLKPGRSTNNATSTRATTTQATTTP